MLLTPLCAASSTVPLTVTELIGLYSSIVIVFALISPLETNARYFFPSTAGATVFYIPSDMILLNVHAAVRP